MYIILLKMVGDMKNMKTLDMMIAAKGTNDWYFADGLWYNQDFGFVNEITKPWPGRAFDNINDLFAITGWVKSTPPIRMTRKEIKEKYNVIVID